jgi:hypothetical protein
MLVILMVPRGNYEQSFSLAVTSTLQGVRLDRFCSQPFAREDVMYARITEIVRLDVFKAIDPIVIVFISRLLRASKYVI